MKPKKRQKMCHNCDGEIDIDVIVCPFCAADLREEKPEQGRSSFGPVVKTFGQGDSASQSLYPPPYTPKLSEAALEEEPTPEEPKEEQKEERPANAFAATALFTMGVQLFLLGLLMLLFSHKGMVVLRWDATYWFIYCLLGIPLLYFGYRALAKL